jgi:methyl-accepting chemotaxis protein
LFSVFIIALSVITSALGIRQMSNTVVETFAVQGAHLMEKASVLVDGDSFEALIKSKDTSDPVYEETRIKLLELKEFSGCLYLYTMSPVSGNIWQFVIDGSAEPDDTENFSGFGDQEDVSYYDDAFVRVWSSGKPETSRLVDQGDWGWLISVYIPIKNSAFKVS